MAFQRQQRPFWNDATVLADYASMTTMTLSMIFVHSVFIAGNPITKDRVPAVAMIGWHVARHWAAGDGGGAPPVYQNGVDV